MKISEQEGPLQLCLTHSLNVPEIFSSLCRGVHIHQVDLEMA